MQERESNAIPGQTLLTKAVAKYAFKLMSYKDEYEVARLHSSPEFRAKIRETFDGDYKLTFHLAPPLFTPKDANTGAPRKIALGPWSLPVFKVLAKMKFLRGSVFDIFGYTTERRQERRLVEEYFRLVRDLSLIHI